MKIKTKLLIGFLSVSAIILVAGILGIIEISLLYTVSKNVGIKNAPLADAAMEIKLNATTAHLWFEEIITGTEEKEVIEKVWQLLDDSIWYVDAMLKGGQNAEGTFYPVNDRVIEAKLLSVKTDAEAFRKMAQLRFKNHFGANKLQDQALDDKFDALFDQFITGADEVEGMLQAKIAQEIQLMAETATAAKLILGIATLLGFIIAALAVYYLSRDILRQVGGEPADIARITRQIAAGNLDFQFESGKQAATGIYAAVQVMVQNLKTVNTDKEQQNWLKTGQAQLNEAMSGEQDIVTLTKQIISFLTTYVEAQVGLFYVLKAAQGDAQKPVLQIIASYAYTANDNLPQAFLVGEGLVGQAALEQKTIALTQRAEECPPIIRSGLTGALPHQVLLLPLLYENSVKGVIEIGFATTVTDIQRVFLEQVRASIGIAVNTAESRTQMQSLLAQTQIQATELQNQQEELRQSNEELQSQSEELQTQQEELRQTNEELEVRTRDLERQRADIRDKNVALEKNQAEMEKAKQAIETKAKELELASKYKSEFLANMSHELRTPLNSMLILAQLLAENKPGNLDEKQVEYAQTVYSAGADLLTLINEILDLSKVEAGKIEIQIENVPLADLIETVEQKFRPLAQQKGLDFHLTVADNIPSILHTDRQRLQQILNNLLSNAFKFTETGEIKLMAQRGKLNASLKQKEAGEDFLAISVTDTGIGIPKEKQQVIFEAFQQADGSTSRRYGGTGLGLSISRQLARLLGGDLTVESEKGKGSTFRLYLPEGVPSTQTAKTSMPSRPIENQSIGMSTEASLSNRAIENQALGGTLGETSIPSTTEVEPLGSVPVVDDRNDLQSCDKSLLIIEDDRHFSSILMRLARERDFKCLKAGDGKTGLQLAEDYQPHAIILDVGLPQLDGLSVMDRLKDNPNTRHIPIHFISASDHGQYAKQMGAIGYLLKPVNMDELGEAFKKIERFIAQTAKNVLVVADNAPHQQQIISLVEGDDVQTTPAKTTAEALQSLKMASFDCIICDVEIESGMGFKLCEQLHNEDKLSQVPVILYTQRDLTTQEEQLLQRCSDNMTVKAVKSPARLLDEATLFLHQVEANLPADKKQMLQMVHDKEAILKHQKVLIVDDDIRNTFALTTFLDNKDMDVIIGNNGQEALALLDKHPDIAIVLMDIMMPEMDGYEAIQKIRKKVRFRKLPIIAITAKAMKGDKAKCIEAGANDYLAKPVDTDQLISLMRVWLYR